MNNESNKNFLIFLGVFILASVVRFVFDSNIYILNIIAGINIIAFWYVCYLILESVKKTFYIKIRDSEFIGEGVKTKKKIHFKNHMKFYEALLLIIGIVYVIFFAKAIVNDIISLSALFLSIETDSICMYIENYFFRKK